MEAEFGKLENNMFSVSFFDRPVVFFSWQVKKTTGHHFPKASQSNHVSTRTSQKKSLQSTRESAKWCTTSGCVSLLTWCAHERWIHNYELSVFDASLCVIFLSSFFEESTKSTSHILYVLINTYSDFVCLFSFFQSTAWLCSSTCWRVWHTSSQIQLRVLVLASPSFGSSSLLPAHSSAGTDQSTRPSSEFTSILPRMD